MGVLDINQYLVTHQNGSHIDKQNVPATTSFNSLKPNTSLSFSASLARLLTRTVAKLAERVVTRRDCCIMLPAYSDDARFVAEVGSVAAASVAPPSCIEDPMTPALRASIGVVSKSSPSSVEESSASSSLASIGSSTKPCLAPFKSKCTES